MFETSIKVIMKVTFPFYYKENRHGTKIAKVSICCDFSNDYEKESKIYYAKCRLRANNVIEWEFGKDCSPFIQSEIRDHYYAKALKAFETMENQGDIL